ncbi:two-component system chemotaxis sensor kinase CheA [Paenibacillus cellulosilyticus]|uniref:Chemotaxis protein CheA n=1 Tax=Paenibacillus cellulosilyticus TaxID=375489 RepID=A0A2V2YYB0_9BACL|nr:chemotaxis protein CheA [Paenibacillus cellulosilyticus]PWW06416.1 two-component system chemotaxis sensor kinase CheA [Paenibacillus cellulosilyticus]QKS46238.1 chemotaxis protein CheA [Paenibacillus cellulosilyticus]
MDMNAYLSMFIDESNDHLQALNENLLKLEGDPNDISIVQVIFRSAHTLKGMSATMGFEDLASLTHEMENVLDLVRNSKLSMDSFIFDTLFKGLDALEAMVQDVVEGGTGKADVSAINAALQSIVKGDYKNKSAGEAASAASGTADAVTGNSGGGLLDIFQHSVLKQSIEAGNQVYYIQVTLRESCVLKAARAYMVFDILENNGEVIKSEPSVQDLEQEKFDRSFVVFMISATQAEVLKSQIEGVSEIELADVVLLDAESLQLYAPTAEARVQPAAPSPSAPASREVAKKETTEAKAQASAGAVAVNRTIRVDIDRLDSLMNLFSELLIDRVRLEQLSSEIKRSDLIETVEHMARVSTDLQDLVLKLRMVPVESVFNRFPRMVRDIAKQLDKKIDLIVTGAETELDRTVIEEIGDPLVHLLRNSLDHGVETPADRIAAGKSETGTVHLRAYHSGNHVFIEVEDDGNGIDGAKVSRIAVKNGVLTEEEAKRLTEEQMQMLIFAAGFSTADKISDISGRGVGLDVVKSKITSLGGHVTIRSKQGQGTVFSIQLPLTLSIISAMLIKMGDEKYAIPLSSIVETGIVQRDQIATIHGNQMIEFRGSVIPVVSLGRVLNVPGYREEDETENEIVVIRKGDKLAALIVDSFIGQSEIVLKSLGKYLPSIKSISGATILGDGQVALIIDPNAFIK